jgi:hypothetical protein
MKKLWVVSALVAGSALLSGLVAAQEVGKVISSTPVMKRVTEPRNDCTTDVDGRQNCRTDSVTEDRNIGYKVVYEYAGKQHTVQLPFPPGATIPLDVRVSVRGASTAPVISSNTVYSAEPEVVQTVMRERVYVDSPYYAAGPYYGGPYYRGYYDPWYPLFGLGLGYAAGYYSHGWRGHRVGIRGHFRGGHGRGR